MAEKNILVTIGDNNHIVAFTMPDPSIALDSAPIYNDAAVLARAIRILVPSNPLSLPVYAPCTREGFEFECCPVGGAIELLIRSKAGFASPPPGGGGWGLTLIGA